MSGNLALIHENFDGTINSLDIPDAPDTWPEWLPYFKQFLQGCGFTLGMGELVFEEYVGTDYES